MATRILLLALTALLAVIASRAAADATEMDLDMDLAAELAGGWRMGLRPRQASTNLQAFAGSLGSAAPPITNSGDEQRPFEVDGDTFPDFLSAADRACDRQKNACADKANNGGGNFEVGDCDEQNGKCKEAGKSATVTSFAAVVSSDDEFDYICDT